MGAQNIGPAFDKRLDALEAQLSKAETALGSKYIYAKINDQEIKVKVKESFFTAAIAFLSSKFLPSKKNYVDIKFGDSARTYILTKMKDEFHALWEDFDRYQSKEVGTEIIKNHQLDPKITERMHQINKKMTTIYKDYVNVDGSNAKIEHENQVKEALKKVAEAESATTLKLHFMPKVLQRKFEAFTSFQDRTAKLPEYHPLEQTNNLGTLLSDFPREHEKFTALNQELARHRPGFKQQETERLRSTIKDPIEQYNAVRNLDDPLSSEFVTAFEKEDIEHFEETIRDAHASLGTQFSEKFESLATQFQSAVNQADSLESLGKLYAQYSQFSGQIDQVAKDFPQFNQELNAKKQSIAHQFISSYFNQYQNAISQADSPERLDEVYQKHTQFYNKQIAEISTEFPEFKKEIEAKKQSISRLFIQTYFNQFRDDISEADSPEHLDVIYQKYSQVYNNQIREISTEFPQFKQEVDTQGRKALHQFLQTYSTKLDERERNLELELTSAKEQIEKTDKEQRENVTSKQAEAENLLLNQLDSLTKLRSNLIDANTQDILRLLNLFTHYQLFHSSDTQHPERLKLSQEIGTLGEKFAFPPLTQPTEFAVDLNVKLKELQSTNQSHVDAYKKKLTPVDTKNLNETAEVLQNQLRQLNNGWRTALERTVNSTLKKLPAQVQGGENQKLLEESKEALTKLSKFLANGKVDNPEDLTAILNELKRIEKNINTLPIENKVTILKNLYNSLSSNILTNQKQQLQRIRAGIDEGLGENYQIFKTLQDFDTQMRAAISQEMSTVSQELQQVLVHNRSIEKYSKSSQALIKELKEKKQKIIDEIETFNTKTLKHSGSFLSEKNIGTSREVVQKYIDHLRNTTPSILANKKEKEQFEAQKKNFLQSAEALLESLDTITERIEYEEREQIANALPYGVQAATNFINVGTLTVHEERTSSEIEQLQQQQANIEQQIQAVQTRREELAQITDLNAKI
jgi:hypothetical protein